MSQAQNKGSWILPAALLGISLVIVTAIAGLSFLSGRESDRAQEQRAISENIVRLNESLLSALKDAETGQRGFLLTGQETYLQPYKDALSNLPQLQDRLKTATRTRPDQSKLVLQIEPLIAEKLAELRATIDLRRANRTSEALAIVNTNQGKLILDQIRTACLQIERSAELRFLQFDTEARREAGSLRLAGTGGAILLFAFLAFATMTIIRGIHRREALLKQVNASKNLLAITLAGIADGVVATDSSGCVTFINPVAEKLTGWSEDHARGLAIKEVFHIVNETSRLTVENPVIKALEQGVAVGLANHTNLISRTGDEVPIDDSAAPLRDPEGNLVGAVLVFRDITARRQAEKRLRDANEELQQFVDAAAHDLRSPLNSVQAMAELLAHRYRSELGPKGSDLIDLIGRGIGRMKQLLDDLLAFARASHFDETGAGPIRLNEPLTSAIENLHVEIERSGASVKAGPLPVVYMHEAHALQLFQNLLGNAMKYRRSVSQAIHIRAEETGTECVVSVTDNGIGIDGEYLEQIFKPFKRLHGDEYPGSGIGLAACRKIVNGYGGRIWASSVLGQGSTFYFTVPSELQRQARPIAS